jgi:hypothetical protein
MQVLDVKRLENPELWRKYCQNREFLIERLTQGGSAFSAVESLSRSRGPVQTTANIAAKSALSREIYPQVWYGVG